MSSLHTTSSADAPTMQADIGEEDGAANVLGALRSYRQADTELRRRGCRELSLTETELSALRLLLRRPDRSARPHELITHLGLTSASITTMLDKLERAGRIERRPVAEDRRGITIHATDQAEAEVDRVIGQAEQKMQEVTNQLPPEFGEHVARLLESMAHAMNAAGAAAPGAGRGRSSPVGS